MLNQLLKIVTLPLKVRFLLESTVVVLVVTCIGLYVGKDLYKLFEIAVKGNDLVVFNGYVEGSNEYIHTTNVNILKNIYNNSW